MMYNSKSLDNYKRLNGVLAASSVQKFFSLEKISPTLILVVAIITSAKLGLVHIFGLFFILLILWFDV